jgi:hypothetical protein
MKDLLKCKIELNEKKNSIKELVLSRKKKSLLDKIILINN